MKNTIVSLLPSSLLILLLPPLLHSLAPDITLVLALTLDFSNVKVGKELGTGAFSTVYEGLYVPYVTFDFFYIIIVFYLLLVC